MVLGLVSNDEGAKFGCWLVRKCLGGDEDCEALMRSLGSVTVSFVVTVACIQADDGELCEPPPEASVVVC